MFGSVGVLADGVDERSVLFDWLADDGADVSCGCVTKAVHGFPTVVEIAHGKEGICGCKVRKGRRART